MFLELLGAVAGGLYGAYAADEKERYAKQAETEGQLMYDASKRAYRAAKSGAALSLTVGTMQNTERNRVSAISAYQAESEAQAAEAVSGTTSGSLQMMNEYSKIQNELAIDRQAEQGQYALASTKMQGDASVAASLVSMVSSLFQYQEASSEAEYARSALAHGLSIGSGALGGVSMGAGIEKALYSTNILSDTGEGLIDKIVGLFKANGAEADAGSGSKVNVSTGGSPSAPSSMSNLDAPLTNASLSNTPSPAKSSRVLPMGVSMNDALSQFNKGLEVSGLSSLVSPLYSPNRADRFTPRWQQSYQPVAFGAPIVF